MNNVIAYLAGLIFAVGLTLAGMTDPRTILAFLDVTGAWDPALLLVMGGAIPVFALAFFSSRGLARPVLAQRFHHPTLSTIDRRLLLGAAIFGVGWGWAGYCPGPALVSAAAGSGPALIFSLAMVLGLFGTTKILSRFSSTSSHAVRPESSDDS